MHLGKDMAVRVEGNRYRGVAQHLRHLLGVHVATEQQARGRVPKVVEANHRKPRHCEERPQFAIQLDRMQVTPRRSTEHQVAIDPQRSGVEPLLDLVS